MSDVHVLFLGPNDALTIIHNDLQNDECTISLDKTPANPIEADRLQMDLGDIGSLASIFALGIEAIRIARAFCLARDQSEGAFIIIEGPGGRARLDLEGKTDDEILEEVKNRLPFTK